MGVATTVRDATNIERANENETRREMIASWYITMPGIPSSEKEQLEKIFEIQSLGKLDSFLLFLILFLHVYGFLGLVLDLMRLKLQQASN